MSIECAFDVTGVDEVASALSEVDADMYERVASRLRAWVVKVYEEATLIVPVRSGFLRSSIYGIAQGWLVLIGASASYAVFVEFGTQHMRARPFLGPAVARYAVELEQIVEQGIQDAIEENGLQ